MKKIFAYDLDGTLLTHEGVAHPETLKALKLIKEKGHINVIATGRGLMHILPLFETNAVDNIDYLICSNGALIYNMHTKTYEVISSLSPDVFEIILDKFKKYSSILRIDSIDQNQTLLPNGKVPSW
ncbi:COF family HAD hydrolase protein, partial [Mycoplasmopsis edwardii]